MTYLTTPYLFENIFALGSVNLLAGMSGAGKTRFAFQLIEEIEQRGTLLKAQALMPVSVAYFAADRVLNDLHLTLNSMNCSLKSPIVSLYERIVIIEDLRLPTVNEIRGHNLIIIDGLDCIVSKLTDSREVGRVLLKCSQLARAQNVAILGILGTAKVKIGEGYEHPRERLIGSSYWARLSADIFLISNNGDSDDDDNCSRLIEILPRNAAPRRISLIFDNGRLVPEIMTKPDGKDFALLRELPDAFTTEDIRDASERLSIPRSTMFRAVRRMIAQGLVVRVQPGQYIKVKLN